MQAQGIRSIKLIGNQSTLDLEVDHPDHNFYAEGIVTSNSHSTTTSMISALTVYLKYKYPLQFFLACLKSVKEYPKPHDEIAAIEKELPYFNIKLLPPDLVYSDLDFKIEGNNIRFGLSFVKGVSEKTITKLANFQNRERINKFGVFQSLKDCGLSVGVGCALIQAGCLQQFGKSRSRLVLELQTWNLLTAKEKKQAIVLGEKFNYDLLEIVLFMKNNVDSNGAPYIKESRFVTIKKHYDPYKEIWKQNSKNEEFANWYYERTNLGFSYTSTLKNVFDKHFDNLMTMKQINDETPEIRVRGIGIVKKCYTAKSKNGNSYAKIIIEDETAEINIKIFNASLELCKEVNNGLPKEDDIIMFKGTKKDGTVFANEAVVQNSKIYMKLRDLQTDI